MRVMPSSLLDVTHLKLELTKYHIYGNIYTSIEKGNCFMKKINWNFIIAHILFGLLCVLAMVGFFTICAFILECHAKGWL